MYNPLATILLVAMLSSCCNIQNSDKNRNIEIPERNIEIITIARDLAKNDGYNLEMMNEQIIEFPEKTCVQFAIKEFSLGGSPIYCFDNLQRLIYSSTPD